MRQSSYFTKLALLMIPVLLFCSNHDARTQADVIVDCAEPAVSGSAMTGQLLTFELGDDTKTLALVNNTDGKPQTLAAGYWRTSSFYSPFDQTVLVWVDLHMSGEEPDNTELPMMELWGSDHTLVASHTLPQSYEPIQRLPEGALIVFDIAERDFLLLATDVEIFGQTETVMSEAALPGVSGFSNARFSYDEFAFSPDLNYIAYKQRDGLNMAIYSLELDQLVWVSEGVPPNVFPMSYPSWSHNGEHLALSLFIDGEMQLVLVDPETTGQTQLTTFPPVQDYSQERINPAGTSITNLLWSPDDTYLAFHQSKHGLHIVYPETRRTYATCLTDQPHFWSPQSQEVLLYDESNVHILNVKANEFYPLMPNGIDTAPIAWWLRD